jgi:hypothetical protein
MPTVTDINSRKKKGATSKKDALTKLGAKDEGFTDGKDNPNIRPANGSDKEEKAPARRTHRPKQEPLIDTAPVIPPVVKQAAESYLEVLDERIALQQREPDLRQNLIDAMLRTKVTTVKINGETLTLETLHKVKKSTDKME